MNSNSNLLLLTSQYIPHGHCYLWQTKLIGLHILADSFIAIAYYSIPIILIYFIRQVDELPFKDIFILFSAFILSCGTTHLGEIWTLWHPNYWILGILKAITALISLYTALSLIPLIPKAINLPSPKDIFRLNEQLQEQIIFNESAKQELSHLNSELEQRVQEKTIALVKANQDLQESTAFREKLVDFTPNILYIYDLITQRNIYCNPFITELLGYSPLELKKFKDGLLAELIHPEDLAQVTEHFQKCLNLKDDKYIEVEYRIKDNLGKWHWLHDKNTVFNRNIEGQVTQILGIAQDVTENKQIQAQAEELNQKLSEKILVLEQTNQARIKLAAMNELIQACMSLEEAKIIIADLLQPLFPNTNGSVYLLNDSKNLLDEIATWGKANSDRYFDPKECWGIRRGNHHLATPDSQRLYCSHFNQTAKSNPTLCLPMIAKGETIGMLHLNLESTKQIKQSTQDLAETVAQNLAMSFANLKLQQKLRYQSLRDPLTGLYNRRYLQEALKRELDRAHRKQHFVSLIMLDVDHFKRFNDTYGHSAGDLVLSTLGNYLLQQTRQYDIPCRYGGEELLIVMPDASIEDTVIRAEEIRMGVKNLPIEYQGHQLPAITISVGISCFPDDSTNPEKLIQAADKALYQAKKAGRDCVKRC